MAKFTEEDDKLIVLGMETYGNLNDRFANISRKIFHNRFSAKQISNRWRNYLNPQLCRDPLTHDEKKFIIERVELERAQKYQTSAIRWKYIIHELKEKFYRLHSENKVRNYWNSSLIKDQRLNRTKGLGPIRIKDQDLKLNRISIKSLLNPE